MKKNLFFLLVTVLLFGNISCNLFNSTDVPEGFKLSSVENLYDLVYGGEQNNDDELVSGMVTDNSGNVYVSMNVTNSLAIKNIIILKIDPEGNFDWGKQYNTEGNDWSPDSGENAETGGTANSIDIDDDGNLYIAGTTHNTDFGDAITIIKINSSDGTILWQKNWKSSWPTGTPVASQDAEGYALDVQGNYIYFTGACGTNQIVVGALDIANGNLFFQYALDIVSGTKDRGYSIKADASGNLFIGGIDGSYAIFAKLTGANTNTPSLDWVKNAGLSYAARINDLDIDATGVYFSCDIRGASTLFEIMKTDLDGTLLWAKSFPGTSDDRNNTHVVKVTNDYLFAGGRIGEENMDKMGDALLLKLSKTDGSLNWAGIYSTGIKTDESSDQRVKGISIVGDNIYIAGQIYPDDQNTEHYYGNWFENDDLNVNDASINFTDITTATFNIFGSAEVRDASGIISDYTSGILQDSKDKTTENAPDGDAFMLKFKL